MYDRIILNRIAEHLCRDGETIAVAESVTAGCLQTALSLANDASGFFQGGITVYNIGQKARHLGVNPIKAQKCDAVSEDIAKSMAQRVCDMFSSDWGVGVVGYASPHPLVKDGEYYAIAVVAYRGEIVGSLRVVSGEAEAWKNQKFFADKIIAYLDRLIVKNGV